MSGVLVVLEHRNGAWTRMSWEAIAAGQQLAAISGGHVYTAALGNGLGALTEEAASHGGTKLHTMEHALLDSVPICHGWSVKRNSCEEVLQPNVVLFEQSIRHMEDALRGVLSCDLLLILGTSLTVEPVSSLPDVARQASRRTVLINLTETDFDPYADLVLHARVGEILAQVLD